MNQNTFFWIGYVGFILIYVIENFFKETAVGLILGVITFMMFSFFAKIKIIDLLIEKSDKEPDY